MRASANTIEKACTVCGAQFRIFVCRDWREHQCSSECKVKARKQRTAALRKARTRSCIACGREFVAQKSQIDAGEGKYCSISCATKTFATTESFTAGRKKSGKTRRMNLALGITKSQAQPRGEDSPCWKGGLEATRRRLSARGAQRIYRKANPERVREWSQRRHARKTGRLPRGTVLRLRVLQRDKCAFCRASLSHGYHVDHILPLALGGKHAPENIQLLCPTCNVRKSAKHPVRFAQEHGKLL